MATEQEKAALTKSRGAVAAAISDPEKKRKFIADSGKMDKDFEGSKQELTDEGSRQYREANEKAAADVMPKMHKGGVVKKDGPHNLQKGETVLPADEKKAVKVLKSKASGVMSAAMDEDDEPKSEEKKESKKEEKSEGKRKTSDKHNPAHEDKKPKHNFHRTEIEHHPNGSHTVRHIPHPPKPSTDGSPVEAADSPSYAAPDMASLHQGMDANLGGGEAGGEPSGAPEGGAPAQA